LPQPHHEGGQTSKPSSFSDRQSHLENAGVVAKGSRPAEPRTADAPKIGRGDFKTDDFVAIGKLVLATLFTARALHSTIAGMEFRTLISAAQLAEHISDGDWVTVDCRFSLDNVEWGRGEFAKTHVSGAVYAHLNEDLSGLVVRGETGRHPLPDVEMLSRTLSGFGIDDNVQVVAYDDSDGAIAARLWWLLRWLGHDRVAVLDGGWQSWSATNGPTGNNVVAPTARTFTPRRRDERTVDVDDVATIRTDPAWRLVDSRIAERFRGEFEPIDPVAGHIPGAINIPHPDNAGDDGKFLASAALRDRFERVLGNHPIDRTVFYCGSGITATRNLLAVAHAGLGDARLYPGSWSEWITDPTRPVATGE